MSGDEKDDPPTTEALKEPETPPTAPAEDPPKAEEAQKEADAG